MKPIIESYANQELSNQECQQFENALDYKPNLKKKLDDYLEFLNHLKTQMLREWIYSILEEQTEPVKFFRSHELNTIRLDTFICQGKIKQTVFIGRTAYFVSTSLKSAYNY